MHASLARQRRIAYWMMSCTRSLICMSSGFGSTSFLMRFQRLDLGRLAFCVASALAAPDVVAGAPVPRCSSCELFPVVAGAGDEPLVLVLTPGAPPPLPAARAAARGCLESIPRATSLDSRRGMRGELLLVLAGGSNATRGAAIAVMPGSIEISPVSIVRC